MAKLSVRPGRRLAALLISAALPFSQGAALAQEYRSQKEIVQDHFDGVKDAIGMVAAVYPPAALATGVFDATFGMLDFFGYFGSSSPGGGDKYLAAIAELQKQIDALDRRMTAAENRLKKLEFRVVENENRTKIDKIAELHKDAVEYLGDIKLGISRKDNGLIANAVEDAIKNADRFLATGGADIWEWADQPPAGGLAAPRFNPSPALPHYLLQLQTIALGIEALDKPVSAKVRDYARKLAPHIAMLTGHDARGEEIGTRAAPALADRIDRAVGCNWRWSQARGATLPHCQDSIVNRPVIGPASKPTENRAFERAIEDAYGYEAVWQMAGVLSRLATRGYVKDSPPPGFGVSTAQSQTWLYARASDGSLMRFLHTVLLPTASPPPPGLDRGSAVVVQNAPPIASAPRPVGPNSRVIQTAPLSQTGAASPGLDRAVTAAPIQVTAAPPAYEHELSAGYSLGGGWDRCTRIFPMTATYGVGVGRQAGHLVYCMRDDGVLLWSQHLSEQNYNRLSPMKQVGTGWSEDGTSFRDIIASGDGVFYAIAPDGRLTWLRHENAFAMPAAYAQWTGHRPVGTGWQAFKDVFSGGRGVLYAIEPGGGLRWYNNTGYATGAQLWAGPRTVGSGWADFRHVFSAGEGDIYAVNKAGDLLWYRHLGWADGSTDWLGPVKLASGWDRFEVVGARIAATPVSDTIGGVR